MKKSISALLIFCLFAVGGCALPRSGSGSFDALSASYSGDARILAERTAEELSRRHAPAHTSLALDRAPGLFGDVLEQKLRADGFALASPDLGGLGVSYKLDVLEAEGAPALGYAQVACSDGQIFSFTRELFKGTEPPFSAPLPEEHPLESRVLPERASAPVATAPDQAAATAMPVTTPGVKVYPVRRTATAASVARRNGVLIRDFCRWNQVGPNATLTKGTPVYLSEPPAGVIPVASAVPAPAGIPAERPVPQSATLAPMPDPVSLPGRAQTSPALTLEKPRPGAPVPYTPAAVLMPAASSPHTSTPIAEAPVAAPVPAASSSEAPMPAAATAIEAVPVWEIHKGEMLRGLMEGWAAIAGYSLIWNAQNDYEMRSSARFSGIFVDAVKNFFAALQANGLALRVTIYQGNKVMEVSEH
ncbi:TcpQ domain-containing protein [Desulfovibrio sp. ZJ369]|uniref:TcpQ domain-containing protein n=2 Tax=unclassified Desulfovibrio TaxID=2593640 RepID=UPI0013EBF65E|nr:TcpQ domain-containing protein [Desulfovibrio sp. ZJ369]